MIGKLRNILDKQLLTEHKQEAEDCIKIYDTLMEMDNGKIWNSTWGPLTERIFKRGDWNFIAYKPSQVGYVFLKGIEDKRKVTPSKYKHTLITCPGYNGFKPKHLNHEVCEHCGNIDYYH
jgi:hypothetical protein